MSDAEMTITLNVLGNAPFWVAWQTEDRKDGKPTKVPYSPRRGKAEANNPKTWGTRAAAESRAARLPKPYGLGGIGLELTELGGTGNRLGGIDLDTCRDPASGAIELWAQQVIDRFASYAEISPSGTGLKIFFTYAAADLPALRAAMDTQQGNEPPYGGTWKRGNGMDHPPGIELYLGKRYFAVTEDRLPEAPEELRLVDTADILWIINEAGPAFAPNKGKARSGNGKARSGGDGSRSAIAFKGRGIAAHWRDV
jgi:putative DNA primase/helicase